MALSNNIFFEMARVVSENIFTKWCVQTRQTIARK